MSSTGDSTEIKARLRKGSRIAIAGLAVNFVLGLTKILGGIFGNSDALIADGVESALDVFGSLVVVGGLRLAAAPADHNHPYGHGKAEPLAAFIVAFALIGAAVGLAAGSIREIFHPQNAPAPFTLAILLLVIVIKEILFRIGTRVGTEVGSGAVRADAWHHRSDAITSIAAFLGISIALIGGKGYEAADDYATLAACCVIAWNGLRLLRPAISELMDTVPDSEIEYAVRDAASGIPEVIELDKCYVRKMGVEYYVDLHIRVDGNISVLEGHRIAHKVKNAIRKANRQVVDVLVHVEPEADETGRSAGLAT